MGVMQEKLETLRQHRLFAELDEAVLSEVATASRKMEVNAGDVVVQEGDLGDAAFVVMGGRLAVTSGGRLLGEATRGDLLGEMALLADEPRAATVTALRASVVLRIDGGDFTDLLTTNPQLHRRVSALLVDRLRRANSGPVERPSVGVVVVLCAGTGARRGFVDGLVGGLRRQGAAVGVRPVDHDGVDSTEITMAELANDVLLLVPDSDDRCAVEAACAHADRVVVAVDAALVPRGSAELRLPDRTPPLELVLLHHPSVDCPRGTHRWLAALHPAAHHHLRRGDAEHLARLCRHLLGRTSTLVLSGGGARGLAHVGTYRALVEAAVPLDAVVGVSAGSMFALAIARGWDPAQVAASARRLLIDSGSPVDATLPTVALASGRRINRRIQEAFGDDDLRLEDLWLPSLLLSTNLTTADVHEHRTGLAWRALRASVAIPGVFPPLAEPEGLLVDGGLLDNLPVGRVRAHAPSTWIIASDAGRRVEFLPGRFPPDGEVSGWEAWRLRLFRGGDRGGDRIPGVVRLLGRLTALGGAGFAVERGDLHIDHELPGVGMFDFAKGVGTMEAGYQRAREVLGTCARG